MKEAHNSDRLVLHVQEQQGLHQSFLLNYDIARGLWVLVFRLFGVEGAMPNQVLELLTNWSGQFGSQCNLEAWRMAPHCVKWCNWKERNSQNFENYERTMSQTLSVYLGCISLHFNKIELSKKYSTC